jgi:hypothetical protein
LLGAARYLPDTLRHALCLDLGHTLVKRAGLVFENGTLTRLHRYASLPVDPSPPKLITGRWVLDFVADAIAQTWDEMTTASDIMLSVASYVQGGHLLGSGLYVKLHELADDVRPKPVGDVRPLLAETVRARTGQPARVHLVHDGSAASAVHAGERRAAVILVGTALGVGFPPAEARGLRPLAAALLEGE